MDIDKTSLLTDKEIEQNQRREWSSKNLFGVPHRERTLGANYPDPLYDNQKDKLCLKKVICAMILIIVLSSFSGLIYLITFLLKEPMNTHMTFFQYNTTNNGMTTVFDQI